MFILPKKSLNTILLLRYHCSEQAQKQHAEILGNEETPGPHQGADEEGRTGLKAMVTVPSERDPQRAGRCLPRKLRPENQS